MVAFDHGLSLGADGLELDVHLSRDGVVVVHHDDTLERTTNGHGPIAARTADELARGRCRLPLHTATRQPRRPVSVSRTADRRAPLARRARRYRQARAHHRAEDDRTGAGAPDDRRRPRRRRARRVALGSFALAGAATPRAHYEPRIPTGAAREETRWALYRSWVRWPLGRTAYREFQVPERAGTTVIVTPRFITHAHRAGLPFESGRSNDGRTCGGCSSGASTASSATGPDIAVPAVREWVSGVRPGSDRSTRSDPGLTRSDPVSGREGRGGRELRLDVDRHARQPVEHLLHLRPDDAERSISSLAFA